MDEVCIFFDLICFVWMFGCFFLPLLIVYHHLLLSGVPTRGAMINDPRHIRT
jgi:hypothetical protein